MKKYRNCKNCNPTFSSSSKDNAVLCEHRKSDETELSAKIKDCLCEEYILALAHLKERMGKHE